MSKTDYYNCLANPFDGPVSGIVDEFAGKTVAFRISQTHLLSTPAGVSYTVGIVKSVNVPASFIQTFAPAADGAINYNVPTNTAIDGATDLATHYDQYRPVALGVKAYYTGAEANTAGTISIAALNGIGAAADFPADADQWFNLPDCHTAACASLTGPIVSMVHAFDRPRFGNWDSTDTQNFFPAIGVMGAGLVANTTGVIRLEISLVVEAIPKYGSVITQHTANVTPHSPMELSQAHRRLPVARSGEASIIPKYSVPVVGAGGKTRAVRRGTIKRRADGSLVSGMAGRRTIMQPPMGRRNYKNKTVKRKRSLYRRRR